MMVRKFFADCMLGRLALWMRVLGFDVAYENAIEDAELAERARREERLILTRDTLLVKRRLVRDNHFFVEGDLYDDQLRQVFGAFPMDRGAFLTRCIRCNRALEDAPSDSVEGLVPPYVFTTVKGFSRCPGCERIYWAGTHKLHMEREVERILHGLR